MVVAALVQVTWAPHLSVLGAFPNLVLVAVVAITWTFGVRVGMAWACAGGVLLDLTATGPIGPHALGLLVGAYLTGFWIRNLDRDNGVQVALAAAASTAAYSLILVGSDDTLGLPVPPLALALQLTLAACVYNAILMPVALALVRTLRPAQSAA
jgi:rod shape-determining protein MreD